MKFASCFCCLSSLLFSSYFYFNYIVNSLSSVHFIEINPKMTALDSGLFSLTRLLSYNLFSSWHLIGLLSFFFFFALNILSSAFMNNTEVIITYSFNLSITLKTPLKIRNYIFVCLYGSYSVELTYSLEGYNINRGYYCFCFLSCLSYNFADF